MHTVPMLNKWLLNIHIDRIISLSSCLVNSKYISYPIQQTFHDIEDIIFSKSLCVY